MLVYCSSLNRIKIVRADLRLALFCVKTTNELLDFARFPIDSLIFVFQVLRVFLYKSILFWVREFEEIL